MLLKEYFLEATTSLTQGATHTRLLFGLTDPKVEAFIRHSQSFGDFNYAMPSLGYLFYGLSFEFGWISDSLHV